MNIILLGYMASGKSKIGVKLAEVLSYSFKDLDTFIENQEKKSVKEIFKDSGELYFRKKEKECLQKLLNNEKHTIISLGGGTPCYFNTMDSLIEDNNLKTVYLNVSIPVIVNRIKSETLKRPLISHLKTDADLTEFIGKHLFERSFFYNKAEFIINANGTVEEIIEDIVLKLF